MSDNFEILVTNMRYPSFFFRITVGYHQPQIFANISITNIIWTISLYLYLVDNEINVDDACWWRSLLVIYFWCWWQKSVYCQGYIQFVTILSPFCQHKHKSEITPCGKCSVYVSQHCKIGNFLKNVKSAKIIFLEFYLVIMEGNRKIFAFVIKQ